MLDVANNMLATKQSYAEHLIDRGKAMDAITNYPSNSRDKTVVEHVANQFESVPEKFRGLAWQNSQEKIRRVLGGRTSEAPLEELVAAVAVDHSGIKFALLGKDKGLQLIEASTSSLEAKSEYVRRFDRAAFGKADGVPSLISMNAFTSKVAIGYRLGSRAGSVKVASTIDIDARQFRTSVSRCNVHSMRFSDDHGLVFVASKYDTGDLLLILNNEFGDSSGGIVWRCGEGRNDPLPIERGKTTSRKEAPWFPFFLDVGTDPSQHLCFASSERPVVGKQTRVWIHSIDLRTLRKSSGDDGKEWTIDCVNFDCGMQDLAQWPHQWQLGEHLTLGVGGRSLSTDDPAPIDNRRFMPFGEEAATDPTRKNDPTQLMALTDRWRPVATHVGEAWPADGSIEATLRFPIRSLLQENENASLMLGSVDEHVIVYGTKPVVYDLGLQKAISLYPGLAAADMRIIPSSRGDHVMQLTRKTARITKYAESDSTPFRKIEEVNTRLARVTDRMRQTVEIPVLESTPKEPFTGHKGFVSCVTISPNGRLVASGSGNQADNNAIFVWDVFNGALVRKLIGHSRGIRDLVFDPDGNTLYSTSDDRTVRVWDTSAEVETDRINLKKTAVSLDLDADANCLLMGSGQNLFAYRLNSLKRPLWSQNFDSEIVFAKTLGNNTMFLGGLRWGLVNVHSVSDGKVLHRAAHSLKSVDGLAITPNKQKMLYGGSNGIILANIADGKLLKKWPIVWSSDVEISPDGRHALVINEDWMEVLDLHTLKNRQVSLPDYKGSFDCCIAPDGSYAIVCGGRGWSMTNNRFEPKGDFRLKKFDFLKHKPD